MFSWQAAYFFDGWEWGKTKLSAELQRVFLRLSNDQSQSFSSVCPRSCAVGKYRHWNHRILIWTTIIMTHPLIVSNHVSSVLVLDRSVAPVDLLVFGWLSFLPISSGQPQLHLARRSNLLTKRQLNTSGSVENPASCSSLINSSSSPFSSFFFCVSFRLFRIRLTNRVCVYRNVVGMKNKIAERT